MKMKDLEQLQTFTIEEFQNDFDNLFSRVENGETFIIKDGEHSAILVPYKETIKFALDSLKPEDEDEEELIRLHTDHEEGS